MDKKSKILLGVFFLLIAMSIGATYYRIVVRRDYLIENQVDCDPTLEKCFVYHCDPATESCTGNEAEDTSYYKIAKRKANKIPDCDPDKDENCQPFVCGEKEKDCGETFCDEMSKQEGEECNDPVQYVIDNPPVAEEDVVVCDPAQDPTCEDPEADTIDPTADVAGDNVSADLANPTEPTNSIDVVN